MQFSVLLRTQKKSVFDFSFDSLSLFFELFDDTNFVSISSAFSIVVILLWSNFIIATLKYMSKLWFLQNTSSSSTISRTLFLTKTFSIMIFDWRIEMITSTKYSQNSFKISDCRIPNWISIRRGPAGLYIHMGLAIAAEGTTWARTGPWNSGLSLCDLLSHLTSRVNIASSLWPETWSLHSPLSKGLSVMWS